jgi:hypothetical protein
MSKTIYKLTKQEFLQAIADFLTKKYGMSEKFEANLNMQIDPITGGIIAEVKERQR